MSVNASSSSNDSPVHQDNSFNISSLPLGVECFMFGLGSFIFTSYIITSTLLVLPLCIFILYHGLQQWRKKRSTSSAAAMSHSDVFTYHMVTIELIGIFGCILCCSGIYSHHVNMVIAGVLFFNFTWFGQVFFHLLTCVERYLAVVHPITYLSLRKERGIRIRNIIISCVLLLCFAGTSMGIVENFFIISDFFLMILSLTVISFCSLSVLSVLIRPGPREQGGVRAKVDQSKQRAFYTIMIILGVLVIRFSWGLVRSVMYVSRAGSDCVMRTCAIWINLPSMLVLPLLFLHRAGKLVCWKNIIPNATELNIHK